MELEALKAYASHPLDHEVRVIAIAGSRCYQIQLLDEEGEAHVISRRGKPMLFRTLDDIYLELKRHGIQRAYLVHQDAHDEVIGRATHYQAPLTSRMPLVF
ncbi:DUF6482 family protein [Litchfieldella xinjiangensis]|uniref:DUF6482 family protein n=1 Tax=Litchfieldella xinjiangensis TaxID=1166948 RepID=UPI0005BB3227|nr:DUF6482 family protein [Halomonas xinjiangensis]